MPPLSDPAILAQIKAVLANWNFTGYVTAKDLALEWMKDELGLTLKDVAKAMNLHCQFGGVIDQQPETRAEWSDWPFHYDLRLPLSGRDVYIETILQDNDPSDPTLHIVSVHDA